MIPTSGGNRPSIQEIIAGQHLADSSGRSISERDLANLMAPLAGLSGGAEYIAMKAGQSLGNALGMKVSKQEERTYPTPYAPTVLALVLALRRADRQFTALYDTAHGSAVEARLPTDLFSFGGTLTCEILESGPSQTVVRAASEIKGQKFDWGKGSRALRDVLDATADYLRRMGWSGM